MTTPTCRLLLYAVADGPHNMAADEVLLESAAAGAASLRLYGWDQATVSLGYFQPEAVRREDARLADLPFVRRPSGGATQVQHHEVTYCLALPPGPPWHDGRSWLERMHAVIVAALAPYGVTGRLHAPSAADHRTGILCYHHFTPGDLLLGAAKVVGSAQRKYRGALMQHGGILLAQSPHTPSLPGIKELTGTELSAAEVASAVTSEFARATGCDVEPGEWTMAERQAVEERAASKYGQASWNCKR